MFKERISHPRRLKAMKTRSQVEDLICQFFLNRDFIQVRTPLLVRSPGMEPHIRPFKLESGAFLPTSPEFAMKKLLVGGLERIFQICPAFRSEPLSLQHHPEFTILEWYRTQAGYEEIMKDSEELFEFLAYQLFGKPSIPYQGTDISVKTPWPRLRVRDLFLEKVGVDLVKCTSVKKLNAECKRLGLASTSPDEVARKTSCPTTWDDLYFKIWLNLIEPNLPKDQMVFVTRYPASQAALSVIDQDPDGTSWSKRFEVYGGGLELGNAFEELTDPDEQKKRFIKDMDLREKIYGPSFPKNPIDEEFLIALKEGMPPSGGIAIGVDRMVMLFADETDLDYTIWLPSLQT